MHIGISVVAQCHKQVRFLLSQSPPQQLVSYEEWRAVLIKEGNNLKSNFLGG